MNTLKRNSPCSAVYCALRGVILKVGQRFGLAKRRLAMNLGEEIQTVLVTGGTGFVGGAVTQRLRSENCAVRALVRRSSDTAALTAAGCELRYGDITDAASVREAMEGVDAVVHCAAFASDWGPRETFVQVNVEGSRHIFDAALESAVKRVVHCSTADVFGIYTDGR